MVTKTGNISPLLVGVDRVDSGVVVDPDVEAFLTATAITDQTQVDAITDLVADLKSNNLWSKCHVIYPMIGGTATTHKYNLKNPANTDGANRLVFHGGWTHSSTGAAGDGSSGYAETFYNPNAHFSASNGHLAFYSRSDTFTAFCYDIGATNSSDTNATLLVCRYSNSNSYIDFGTSLYPSFSSLDGRGLFQGVCKDATTGSHFRNGVKSGDFAAAPVYEDFTLYIGACNKNGSATYFSPKQCAFASFGDTMTSTQAATFYSVVQTYQMSLARQV